MLKINPTQEALDFHFEKVSEILDKIRTIEKTEKGVKYKLSQKLLDFINEQKDKIISGKPKILHEEINSEYNNLNLNDEERKAAKVIFKYAYETYFQNKYGKEFLNLLDIDTCVYCNLNYTLQFDLETNHARAQLDHWFPKESFPILALSFYNLIPSCASCNHIKGAAKGYDWLKALENQNHPYSSKNDFTFSYEYESFNNFAMKIKVEKNSKSEKTLAFNKTKEIYNAHSEKELKDLLELRLKYSEDYIDTLVNKTFKGITNESEVYRMIFGIEVNEDDYHKRPFSKFKKDIIHKLLSVDYKTKD